MNMLEKPTLPKRASQMVFALQDFTELVLLAARCGLRGYPTELPANIRP